MLRLITAITSLILACLDVQALTVVTWNVWNGFDGGKSRDDAAAWLAAREPDIVAFQELNGQTEQGFSGLAKEWGHAHSVILKQDGYPVGLTSRTPIEGVVRHREGFSHGCLQARVGETEIFVVHLHPGDWRIRESEMKRLTAIIRPLLAEQRRVLVLGDFNAHSPVDRGFLAGQTRLLEKRKGTNLRDGAFDFSVMEGFLDCGLKDLSVEKPPANRSFPTRVLPEAHKPDDQAGLLERIDFILGDSDTAASCREVRYPADESLDRISDHYPVVARFAADPQSGDKPVSYQMVDPAKNPLPKEKRRDLSVNVGGGKGVLIAPHWVLTASHCVSSRKQGVTAVTYVNAEGKKVSIQSDRVIRNGSVDLALVRLTRPAQGRDPVLLLKDGFPVTPKGGKPHHLRKVAGNGVWEDIPARVSAKSGGERFYVSEDERHGKAGTSGSPWVIHSALVGDVLVGVTHGTGRVPQVGRVCEWIERTVSGNGGDRILWTTPQQALAEPGAGAR